MKSIQRNKKSRSRTRLNKTGLKNKSMEIPYKFNIKLFITLGLLLVILLMKKYGLSIGNFNVDSFYNVVYYNEDINSLKSKVFFFKKRTDDKEDIDDNLTIPNTKESDIMVPKDNTLEDNSEENSEEINE